jgi:hypothetical protein
MLTPLVILVFTFAGASIAVAWHRRLILGEPPGFSGSNVATKGLWRYVGIGFAIALIAFLPLLVVVLPIFILSSSVITGAALKFAMFVAASFLIYLTAFAVFLRLSLLLPARAVGDLDLTFNETWKRTRGNTWRMFWGIVACTVPPMLAVQLAVRIVSFGFLSPGMLTATRLSAWPPPARFFSSSSANSSLSRSGSAFCPTPTGISSGGPSCNLHGRSYPHRSSASAAAGNGGLK